MEGIPSPILYFSLERQGKFLVLRVTKENRAELGGPPLEGMFGRWLQDQPELVQIKQVSLVHALCGISLNLSSVANADLGAWICQAEQTIRGKSLQENCFLPDHSPS